MNEGYASDLFTCWSQCKATENCNWFSYDSDALMCTLFEVCLKIDNSKTQFLSGKKECSVENTGKSHSSQFYHFRQYK